MSTALEQFRNMPELIDFHLRTHKGMEIRDVYKLLHQSIFGPEHLWPAVAENIIKEEMDRAGVRFEEPLLEPISIDGSVCRINLRAAKRLCISAASIAEAVKLSVEGFSRNPDELAEMWECVGNSLTEFVIQFRREDFEELARLARIKGFPPLHHSESYRKYNRPAYRVLKKQVWKRFRRPFPSSTGDL